MDITSRKNEKVRHMKKLGSAAFYRREQGLFVCDGRKLFEEAVKNGMTVCDVFYLDGFDAALIPAGAKAYRVTEEVMEAASSLTTPRDVLFSVKIPDNSWDTIPAGSIILENIQDPGNAGTMVRTANALGVPAVVFCGACADIYSPKCVRSTMGAVFREKMIFTDFAGLAEAKKAGLKIAGAALSDKSKEIGDMDLTGYAVAVGNEGSGLTDEFISLCDEQMIIPMLPECESLNAAAAAAIIMWEMVKCLN